eukprot:m.43841 g.43841  ORF g.43841 m.43841 type:complete len:177 (-) comp14844_c0_seq2:314-844(-)
MAPGKESASSCSESTKTTVRVHSFEGTNVPVEELLGRYELRDAPKSSVAPGDVVLLLECMTGGGDFEGLFFAGPLTADGHLPLLVSDAEFVDFPSPIRQLVTENASNMLTAYRPAIIRVFEELDLDIDDWYENPNDMAAAFNNVDDAAVQNPPQDGPVNSLSFPDLQHVVLLEYTY